MFSIIVYSIQKIFVLQKFQLPSFRFSKMQLMLIIWNWYVWFFSLKGIYFPLLRYNYYLVQVIWNLIESDRINMFCNKLYRFYMQSHIIIGMWYKVNFTYSIRFAIHYVVYYNYAILQHTLITIPIDKGTR